MDTQTKVTILGMAQRVRKILEKAAEKGVFQKDACYSQFPVGCSDAAFVLGQYLLEKGIKTVDVKGTYHRGGTNDGEVVEHIWLMMDDYFLDITGDQFKDDEELLNNDVSIYFGHTNDFYGKFEISFFYAVHRFKGIDSLQSYDENGKKRLMALYEYVSRYSAAMDEAAEKYKHHA